ncbi:MAG: GTP diphosphokinase [Legionellales bacterium RIFCSPHIGHO2_12_FULL_42_9]|nr:MAG: GTP diphosphokinase [Legionellales bacterium RIFCSPHIGHO2_12_FULL_42_9]
MVKIKVHEPWTSAEGQVDLECWLRQIEDKGYSQGLDLLRRACTLSQLAGSDHPAETGVSCLELGLLIGDVLADLQVDLDTLVAAIVFECTQYAELSLDVVLEQLGPTIAKLIKGVIRMGALQNMQVINKHQEEKQVQNKHQIDNIRKMLLAMVDDPRVVLIKLAERLCILRTCRQLPETIRRQHATEAMEIYAPLANRLGIGAIKWELEDLAFRYLLPDNYKAIAKGLKAKRIDRDQYVNLIVDELNQEIKALGISHFEVYGRSKHIHSIYRKMTRKNVPLEAIYDATAVRILVENSDQCYEVLGLVHSVWKQILAEFDDYINNPKSNGYQSLHTAVEDVDGRVFEVQIRTFAMHERAEMGVAAHWKYKEGGKDQKEGHERKIAWLRDVLAWHHEVAVSKGVSEAMESGFLDDRVYVFTPGGDVIELPQGVTPLDFAYHIHSHIGHCCRGAKVNGAIVPLTYELKTGDRVEVLTGKEERPSRDWINPHLTYLKTSRAKAKVMHWFRMQDFEEHKTTGHEIAEKELKSLGIKVERLNELVDVFNFKRLDDVYAAIGRGDLKVSRLINRLTPTEAYTPLPPRVMKVHNTVNRGNLSIEGVGNLLTHMARCCQPVPGDDVIGYITLGRGVSIHRQDCVNIIHSSEKQRQRFLQVSWDNTIRENYVVHLLIRAFNRTGLLRDITSLLSNEKANVYALESQTDKEKNTTQINLTVEIDGINSLSRLLSRLQQVPNVFEARRYLRE